MAENKPEAGSEAERENAGASVNANAFAAAVAMDSAGDSAEVAADAAAFLKSQRTLTELQIKHFDQERHLAIFGTRLKLATQLFIVAVMAVIG